MKTVLCALFISFNSVIGFSQAFVGGHISNPTGSVVAILLPIEVQLEKGLSRSAVKPFPIEADGSVQLSVPLIKPSIVFISFLGEGNRRSFHMNMILQPGDSVFFDLDFKQIVKDGKFLCQFRGPNAEGHQQWYDYAYYPPVHQLDQVKMIVQAAFASDMFLMLKQEIERQMQPFDQLYQAGKIDAGFYGVVENRIKSTLLTHAGRTIFDRGSRQEVVINLSDAEQHHVMDQIFAYYSPEGFKMPLTGPQIAYTEMFYAYRYAREHQLDPIDTPISFNGKSYTVKRDFVPLLAIDDASMKEYLIANAISRIYQIYETSTDFAKEELDLFNAMFPGSKYMAAVQINKDIRESRTK